MALASNWRQDLPSLPVLNLGAALQPRHVCGRSGGGRADRASGNPPGVVRCLLWPEVPLRVLCRASTPVMGASRGAARLLRVPANIVRHLDIAMPLRIRVMYSLAAAVAALLMAAHGKAENVRPGPVAQAAAPSAGAR